MWDPDDWADWSRPEQLRWWLDRDEPERAAQVLEIGDPVDAAPGELSAIGAALKGRGLELESVDGRVYVGEREGGAEERPAAPGARLPPARMPGVAPALAPRAQRDRG